MSFLSSGGHVIPGSRQPASTVYVSTPYPYYASSRSSKNPIAACVAFLITSVALAVFGILALTLGDVFAGSIFTAIGGLGIALSVAGIIYCAKQRIG